VAQRVARGRFGDAGRVHRGSKGALEDRFVEVMPASLAGGSVEVQARCGEHPLPGPFARGGRILEAQRAGEFDATRAGAEVGGVLVPGVFELLPEIGGGGYWEECDAIPSALALSNDDMAGAKVQIFDAESGALGDAQAGAVQELRHQKRRAVEVIEDAADFVACEYDR